jgi:hypothetical protein
MSTSSIVPSLSVPVDEPDLSTIVTEDDTPVDNIYSLRQMGLLIDPLYASWSGPPPEEGEGPRSFVALANVGVFGTPAAPPVVPDVLLAVDVSIAEDVHQKKHRTWFNWVFGKSPDLVVEVVSNTEGAELTHKKKKYRDLRVPIYVVWDPEGHLGGDALHCFELRGMIYGKKREPVFPSLGLGLIVWEGSYEGCSGRWLRWIDAEGTLLPTGAEAAAQERARAAQERARAEQERARAEQERARAEQERARAERLAARLRELGIDPEAK